MEDSATHEKKQLVEELHGFIRVYSDGSVERPDFPGGHVPACPDFVGGVASEDVAINTYTGVSARIHLPQSIASSQGSAPIVLHFHSGGFCTGSTDGAIIHAFCSRMALQSKSIWVSVNYRLAPERRLPAAYDDAYTSFMWLHTQAVMADGGTHHSQHDESSCPDQPHDARKANLWLRKHADYSRCFLAGESAGGAIIHYLMMRISGHYANWSSHIHIRGLLMIHPTFAIGEWITAAFDPRKELRAATTRRLSLPDGAELDHPLVNPLHAAAPSLKHAIIPPCQIAVADQDERYAAAMQYLRVMKECGHPVQAYVTQGKGHCFYLRDPRCKESELLVEQLVAFICEH